MDFKDFDEIIDGAISMSAGRDGIVLLDGESVCTKQFDVEASISSNFQMKCSFVAVECSSVIGHPWRYRLMLSDGQATELAARLLKAVSEIRGEAQWPQLTK
ncbi:hypothetical protein [Parasutterella excrementihominis]|uniref:hypothetical protein n=1 Tax=Parasutterella excrementihominis TaxID=487175 RepID=UPI0022E899FD|nr:hypothetical protein [Parasutterella excrementihominis]